MSLESTIRGVLTEQTAPKEITEAKDPNEYDQEGDMMKSQLRQIDSAIDKLMGMVKDDDNLPEWVQSKMTKATDYIRSVRDYLESEKMNEEWVCGKCNCDPCTCEGDSLEEKFANPAQQAAVMAKLKKDGKYKEEVDEKTLTPAELKKREEIAKAIERENPDMPMPQKMAIATAQAKKTAEAYDEPQGQAKRMMSPLQKARMDKEKADRDRDGKLMNVKTKPKTEATMKSFSEILRSKLGSYAEATDDDYNKTLGPTKNSDEGIAALKKKHGMSHTKAVATMKRLMGEGKVDEISMGKMQSYGKAAAKDIDQKRNKVKAALDQPASVKHAKAGMKAMQGLTKRSRGSDMYVNKMTGRSKVKPTAEETVNELDKKTLGSYIKKAGPDAVKQTAQAKRHSDAGDMADKDRDMYKAYAKSQRAMDKAKNRQKGISKAVDKLTREATIPDGQTAMTKRPELTSSDAEKLAKIRKMLNREKKK